MENHFLANPPSPPYHENSLIGLLAVISPKTNLNHELGSKFFCPGKLSKNTSEPFFSQRFIIKWAKIISFKNLWSRFQMDLWIWSLFYILFPGLSQYTEAQQFWLSLAQFWCGNQFSNNEFNKLDAHSPWQFRVIGPLTQSSEFSRDWSCPAGAPMNPVNRCGLWWAHWDYSLGPIGTKIPYIYSNPDLQI